MHLPCFQEKGWIRMNADFIVGVLLLTAVGAGTFFLCLRAYREGVEDGIIIGATLGKQEDEQE